MNTPLRRDRSNESETPTGLIHCSSEMAIVGMGLLVFCFYLYHLAPDIVWNDTCKLAYQSYVKSFEFSPGGHTLRNYLGHLWGKLPFSSYIFGQNLFSAVFSSLAILVLGFTLNRLSFSLKVVITTMCALAVSHTIWFLSEITESYSLMLFLLACEVQAFASFMDTQGKLRKPLLFLMLLINALGILNHQLAFIFLFLPFAAFLKLTRKDQIIVFATAATAVIAGLSVLFFHPSMLDNAFNTTMESVNRYIYPRIALRELCKFPFYLAVNFPWLAFFIGGWRIFLALKKGAYFQKTLLIQSVLVLLFASAYGLGRKFFLLIPVYYIFAFFLAQGLETTARHLDKRKFWMLASTMALSPIITYNATYRILNYYHIYPISKREIPFRDTNRFYIWPGKRGLVGPRKLIKLVCEATKKEDIVLMDWQIYTIFRYVRDVEEIGDVPVLFVTDSLTSDGLEYATANTVRNRLFAKINNELSHGRRVFCIDPMSLNFITKSKRHVYLFPELQKKFQVEKVDCGWEIRPLNSTGKKPARRRRDLSIEKTQEHSPSEVSCPKQCHAAKKKHRKF